MVQWLYYRIYRLSFALHCLVIPVVSVFLHLWFLRYQSGSEPNCLRPGHVREANDTMIFRLWLRWSTRSVSGYLPQPKRVFNSIFAFGIEKKRGRIKSCEWFPKWSVKIELSFCLNNMQYANGKWFSNEDLHRMAKVQMIIL